MVYGGSGRRILQGLRRKNVSSEVTIEKMLYIFSLLLLRKLCNCCKGRRAKTPETPRNKQERSLGVKIKTKPVLHWKPKVNGNSCS